MACLVAVCRAHDVDPCLNGSGGAMAVKHGDVCILMGVCSGKDLVCIGSDVWVISKCLVCSPDMVSGGGRFGFRERKVLTARVESSSGFGTG